MRRLLIDLREMVSEQIEYRELLTQVTLRDLLLRYKQSVMGFGWAILMPVVNTVIFTVIFTRVASPIDTPVPYVIFAYCGFWVWNGFATAVAFAATALVSNSNLVSKVYFPREIFPISAVAVCMVDFLVGAIPLIALMVWYRVDLSWTVLWLPAIVLVHVGFTLAVSLFLSMANLFYRDVKYLVNIGLQVWMFATPVIYPLASVDGRLGQVLGLNPMAAVVESYRRVLLEGGAPPGLLTLAAGVTAMLLLGSWLAFHRAEFRFAENI
jgi:lipopolysaccharide transport system permease protein